MRASLAPGLDPPNNRKNPQYKTATKIAAALAVASGQRGGSPVIERKTSANSSNAATNTRVLIVQIRPRPESGGESQSSLDVTGEAIVSACSAAGSGAARSGLTGNSMT